MVSVLESANEKRKIKRSFGLHTAPLAGEWGERLPGYS